MSFCVFRGKKIPWLNHPHAPHGHHPKPLTPLVFLPDEPVGESDKLLFQQFAFFIDRLGVFYDIRSLLQKKYFGILPSPCMFRVCIVVAHEIPFAEIILHFNYLLSGKILYGIKASSLRYFEF